MILGTEPDFIIDILAFHGTTEKIAKNIVATSSFKIGKFRKDHWLGQGVYFYREDYRQALIWAKYKIKQNKSLNGNNASVLYTYIPVKRSQFLNLDSRDGLFYYKKFLNEVKRKTEEKNMELEISEDKKEVLLMCLYCDMLPKEIKVIQRTYPVKSEEFDSETSLLEVGMNLHGTQLCVRDTEKIDYQRTGMYSIASVAFTRKKQGRKRNISFEKEW